MSSIQVLSRTQRIIVDSTSAVSIVNAGPMGPQGIQGLMGETPELDMFVVDTPYAEGDRGILSLALDVDDEYSVLHTDIDGSLKVSGPVTDAELRATPVPIVGAVATGGLTDDELRAAPVNVSGTVSTGSLTDVELRATPIPVTGTVATGGLTNTELRDSPVPVSGPLTDTELRDSPVPVTTGLDQGLTDTQLRANPVPISGTVSTGALTDSELRASSLPVTLDAASLTALETVTVVLDAASLASLETINVENVAGTEFAEDAPHVDGAAGSLSLAVRRDSDTSSVSADGDYAALLVDAIGRLKVRAIKDNQIVNGTITIPNAGNLSTTGGDSNNGIVDLRLKTLVGIQMPAAWTTAVLTFQVSMDGGTTFSDLYDESGTERSVTVAVNRSITLDPTKFIGATHIKIRSGTSAAPVVQAAARTLNYTTIAL
jgi:hypothetical protein